MSPYISIIMMLVHQFKVAPVTEGRYKAWGVKFIKEGQRSFLRGLDTKGAIRICNEGDYSMEVLVECTRSMQVEKLLQDRDITFENTGSALLLPPDPKSLKRRSNITRTPSIFGSRFMRKDKVFIDWNDYYPLNNIYNWMEEIEKLYPATCTTSDIGKSVEGRPIKMLKISNSDASNTGVWLDACMHAREWIGVSVVTYIANYIARNFSTLPPHLTNKDWYIVPVVNPDGYHFSYTTERLWRKNRARFGNTIVGVDLNRNFGYNWGLSSADSNSMGDPLHHNYRGTESFSEPECSAVKDLILYSGTPFKIFITFHSFSEVISFPWCFTTDPCPDYVSLLEGGAVMAKAIFDTTGKMYKVGNFKDIMYFASGTSVDWSYGTAKIPFSYLIELRGKEHKFLLPKGEIEDCCREALAAIKALSEFVEKTSCLNCTIFSRKKC